MELSHWATKAHRRASADDVVVESESDGVPENAISLGADILVSLAIEHGAIPQVDVDEIVSVVADTCESSLNASSFSLYLRASASAKILQLPPRLGVDVQLRLLAALGPVSDASLWVEAAPGRVVPVAGIGCAAVTRRFRAVALTCVADDTEGSSEMERNRIHGVPVLRWQHAVGAVVARSRPDERARASRFLRECALRIAPLLEREMLLTRSTDRDRTLHSASERRLLRLGFDLHDGPLQEIAALASDLRLAREQVASAVEGRLGRILVGRFDDLDERLSAIDGTLRAFSRSLESSGVGEQPLADTIRREVESFDARMGLSTRLVISGSLDHLSASQRIALFRIAQEALSNIRDHTAATQVSVTLEGVADGTRLVVTDNGGGFDVSRTVVAAARRGRLGLVGMNERVRLLGGMFSVRSAPGEQTEVSVTLPRWEPVAAVVAAAAQQGPS